MLTIWPLGSGVAMNVIDVLLTMGGVASYEQLRSATKRRQIEAAVQSGAIKRIRRGLYVLAEIDRHRQAAARLNGVVSHLSAAQLHGWAVRDPPTLAWVTVPRSRKVRGPSRAQVVHADLGDHEITRGLTSPLRTVLDCARRLPFDQALAVADSALRSGMVHHEELIGEAERCRGSGSAMVRRVAAQASRCAANPLESVLRAIASEQLDLVPQVAVATATLTFHPDLVDEERRMIVEAESFEWHGHRDQYRRDVERYTLLTAAGWIVLRFTWEQVMLNPDFVRRAISDALACNRSCRCGVCVA